MNSGKKRRQYPQEHMRLAIEAVRSGRMSKKHASKVYGVPRSTLLDKLAGRAPEDAVAPGTKPVLTQAEEKCLVKFIIKMANIGYPLARRDLLLEVKKILDLDGRPTPFRNNMPGKDWFYGFARRNPEVSLRTPQSLGHERAAVSEEMIRAWFQNLESFLQNEVPDYKLVIKDPRRVFNADETGFPLCVKSGKVLAATGSKHVYQVVANNKTQITVMACFNALGDYMPPLIVYPGQRLRDIGISSFPEAIFGQTDNGWMDSGLFVCFLEHLLAFVQKEAITLPVILFVDGHSTHMTLDAAEFCAKNGIILYCLLPNATHILQACDIGLFSPMKSAWISEVRKWQMEHLGEVFTKKFFPGVFRKTWERVATLDNSVQGFKKSGLYPLSPEGVDFSKLGPSKLITRVEEPPKNVENVENEHPNAPSTPARSVITVMADVHAAPHDVPIASKTTPLGNVVGNTIMPAERQSVSPAFDKILSLPAIQSKKSNNIRNKLPKALSGKLALAMLREKKEQKQKAEADKLRRKEERITKRNEREREKECKRIEQERKKNEREAKKQKKSTKVMCDIESESASESDEEIKYMDTSDSEVSEDSDCRESKCFTCCSEKDKGAQNPWVGCDRCSRWFHLQCCKDDILMAIDVDEISNYEFLCYFCK